jgi:hypothetical protein
LFQQRFYPKETRRLASTYNLENALQYFRAAKFSVLRKISCDYEQNATNIRLRNACADKWFSVNGLGKATRLVVGLA